MSLIKIEDLQEILDSLGINASELSRQTHVSRSYMSHLLSGRKNNPSKLWALQVVRYCREQKLNEIADRLDGRMNPDE